MEEAARGRARQTYRGGMGRASPGVGMGGNTAGAPQTTQPQADPPNVWNPHFLKALPCLPLHKNTDIRGEITIQRKILFFFRDGGGSGVFCHVNFFFT